MQDRTFDLFNNQGPEFARKPDRLEVVAGKVVATMNKPSAAQKRFNALMDKLHQAQDLDQSLRRIFDEWLPRHNQAVAELQGEADVLVKGMLVLLDARIQAPTNPKGLTANQKQQAVHMAMGLCAQLEGSDDPEVQALQARYNPVDEEDEDTLRAQTQALAEAYLGDDFAQGKTFSSPEEVLQAAMAHERQKAQAQQEKLQAKRDARKAAKKPTARAVAQEQAQMDAQQALRTVYRQLASALHPDREPDAAVRQQKTALMSEVNAAYERQDLSVLLRIQLQTEFVDANKAAAVSDDKLKAMCKLLDEQLKAMEHDNFVRRMALDHEVGFPAYTQYSDDGVRFAMDQELESLRADVNDMRTDLERVHDDKELKTWLKEQVRASKAQARMAERMGMHDLNFVLDEILGGSMRR